MTLLCKTSGISSLNSPVVRSWRGYLFILVSAAQCDVICGSFVPPELDLSPSDWPEIKALQAHEWLQR